MATRLLLCAMLGLAACGGDDVAPPLPVDDSRPECENLDPLLCLAPWPSSRYLAEDAATATGYRVRIPVAAMPRNRRDVPVDPEIIARFDGFSPLTSILTVFDGEVDASNLPGEDRIAESLLPGSATVLLDAETGERVPHFSELDEWPMTDERRAAFYVRPAVRLREGARYIVAIRGVQRLDGAGTFEPSPYFRALRDDVPTASAELEGRRAHFDALFATLEAAGVARADLQQAWDFRTASGASTWSDLVAMRDDAMDRVGEAGLGCTITEVEEHTTDEHEANFRFVTGTFTAPLYMEDEGPAVRLVRDAAGRPMFNRMVEVPFTVAIPHSVAERVRGGGAPARLLTYGHGLFGSQDEVRAGWLQRFLHDYPTVAVGTDWWGMSEDDVLSAAEALSEMSQFPKIAERLMQGVVNFLVMTRSLAGACRTLPELGVDGMPTIDGDERYYLGISQGGIMGTTVAAVSQDIERFILQVGGVSYPIMMKRSVNFPTYALILNTWYDVLDGDLLLVASASLWDLAEPSTYAPHLVRDPLPGTSAKRILYMTGWYDAQVPNVSSDIAMRTAGVPLLVPSVRDVFGIDTTMGPADSAYVQYRISGVEPFAPGTRSPPRDNAAHEGVRRTPAAQRQMDAFLRPDGVVQSFCDGPCDPE